MIHALLERTIQLDSHGIVGVRRVRLQNPLEGLPLKKEEGP